MFINKLTSGGGRSGLVVESQPPNREVIEVLCYVLDTFTLRYGWSGVNMDPGGFYESQQIILWTKMSGESGVVVVEHQTRNREVLGSIPVVLCDLEQDGITQDTEGRV